MSATAAAAQKQCSGGATMLLVLLGLVSFGASLRLSLVLASSLAATVRARSAKEPIVIPATDTASHRSAPAHHLDAAAASTSASASHRLGIVSRKGERVPSTEKHEIADAASLSRR